MKGLTQEALAYNANLQRRDISLIENDKRHSLFDSIVDIAYALGVPLSQIQPPKLDKFLRNSKIENIRTRLERFDPITKAIALDYIDNCITLIEKLVDSH